jgi:S-formylglutathione hydrolase FrmB
MSLTGWPLLVLLVTLAVLTPLFVALTWRRPPGGLVGAALRFLAMLFAQLLAVAAVGVWANNTFGFYDNWSDLWGGSQSGTLHAETNGSLPLAGAEGRVVALTVNGGASRAGGIVLVWLPREYDRPAFKNARFPVLMMLPGQPGTPEGVFTQFEFARQATQAIRSHAVKPFVAVFPPLMIAPPRDTECTDVPHGPQAETWLAEDVRTAVARHVRVTPDAKQWSAAGWSTGGFCAAKLLLRHRNGFNAAASMGGYFTAETDPTTGNLFNGSAQLRRENSPSWLIRQPGQSDANLLIVVSKNDRHSYNGGRYADSKQMIAETRGYPNVATIVLPSGGHNYTNYRQTLPGVFAWCARTAGL